MKLLLINFSISLVVILSGLTSKADYIRVGNGGEGYKVAAQIFTRDLVDYDVHVNPWFGITSDAVLRQAVSEWNPLDLSETECELLARKLTDLNKVKPFLGDDLLLALRFFNWTYSEQDLVLIEPDEIRRPIEQSKRVAIANRLMQSILINRSSFQALDSKNKVALILHEVVYALMKVTPGAKGSFQSLAITRQVTAGFFSSSVLSSSGFTNLLDNYLETSPRSGKNARDLLGRFIQVVLTDTLKVPWTLQEIQIYPVDETQILNDLTALCSKHFKEFSSASVVSFYHVPPRSLISTSYKNRDGIDQYALRVVEYYNQNVDYNIFIRSEATCAKQIYSLLQKEMTHQ